MTVLVFSGPTEAKAVATATLIFFGNLLMASFAEPSKTISSSALESSLPLWFVQ